MKRRDEGLGTGDWGLGTGDEGDEGDKKNNYAHWCQLNVKASLKLAFRLPRSQSPTGNAVLEAPPLLLAAEPLLSCISSQRLETRF
ncbi:MAG: hypothetical protein V7L11_00570 [Nostoc sp.]|uniref:hypothetical protein n=1 Tax=Nostoc sp. TaxID=1180 RepID=UPI002FF7A00F